MPSVPSNKRHLVLLLTVSALLAILFLSSFHHSTPSTTTSLNSPAQHVAVHPDTLSGGAIMPKLGNATAKAELGRASWKLFHTIMSRFPDKPSVDERTALQSYIHLFTRLYPCGECAEHFRVIVEKFPPQVSSRSAAAAWACHVHNEVNVSLEKEIFDCSNIGDFYDCGCADDEKAAMGEEGGKKVEEVARSVEKPEMRREDVERMTGDAGREFDIDLIKGSGPLRIIEGR
ncbi:hypothetical protein LTR17_025157 [Elasticomyces elasticus]|nr:hypothetical protein LTR17_025157 [Elasticomyces elasticus]